MTKPANIVFSIIIILAFSLPSARGATPTLKNSVPLASSLTINVSNTGWGEGRPEDIEKVLYSAASEIFAYVPNRPNLSIIVRHTDDHPVTLFKQGPNGEFVVLLTAEDRRWSQFAYQFAHEFCHVLAMNSKTKNDPNQWFEESLCETASLFALRRMARTWRSSPPYPNWKDYASALGSYAQDSINERHRILPSDTTLAEWLEENEDSLRNDPYLRDKNELVANQLLPLFENDPGAWGAVTYLNMSQSARNQSFQAYLKDWYARVPSSYEATVQKIARKFDLSL